MKIIIETGKKGLSLKPDEPTDFDTMMDTLLTAVQAVMNDFAEKAPHEHKQQIKEAIYDNFNEAASAILANYIPDKELRPDLTAEAIKKMEDKIMKEHVNRHEAKHGEIKS